MGVRQAGRTAAAGASGDILRQRKGKREMTNCEKLLAADYSECVMFENPDYDSAIVGIDMSNRVVYDMNKMAQFLIDQDGMSREEAIEFIEYNSLRAVQSLETTTPIIMTMIEDL